MAALAGSWLGAELVATATRRSTVLQAGVQTGVACAALTTATALLPGAAPVSLGQLAVGVIVPVAAGVVAAAAVLTLGAPLERLFGHATRLTLSEWLNYDHALVQELSVQAPGTFQHSINVALLADAAAREIRADALLARVGALYHDVGKTLAADYYIENQRGANPHDALSPVESAAILRRHVTDGVLLLRQHRMGERLADFAREHHGTGVMRYFLDRADCEARATESFRYPGPQPRSKETAIVMIADQIEAASRANQPADETASAALVTRVVDGIERDGQLAQCGLTSRDVERVRAACVRRLTAMYHRRLVYPPAQASPHRRRITLIPGLRRGRANG
ncbi:MAG: HDIG domain-containing metalloprotein [Vicinamibacteraceae bacterium]